MSSWRIATCGLRKATGAPDLGEEFLAEDFCRCFVAEAFAWRCVQVMQISARSRPLSDRGLTSLESHFLARPLVFSAVPFCQGDSGSQNHVRVPIACLQIGPVGEFGASIEGDRRRARWGRYCRIWIRPSITGLYRRSLLRRTTANRLTRSTCDVTSHCYLSQVAFHP